MSVIAWIDNCTCCACAYEVQTSSRARHLRDEESAGFKPVRWAVPAVVPRVNEYFSLHGVHLHRAQTVTIPVLDSSVSFSPAAGAASFGLASGAWQATAPASEAASHNHVLFAVASYQLPQDFTPTAGARRPAHG